MRKPAPVDHPVHDLVRERWSPRAFDPRPLDDAALLSVLEAARWAPSSSNEQPWRFLVARRRDEAAWSRLAGCLVPGNRRWALAASVLALAVARLDLARSGKPNRHAFHDVGLAVAALLYQATALDLAVHPMAGFDVEAARAAFGVPAGFEPVTAIALGHPGAVDALPEDLQARELAPRVRRPLAATVWGATWGEPAPFVPTTGGSP